MSNKYNINEVFKFSQVFANMGVKKYPTLDFEYEIIGGKSIELTSDPKTRIGEDEEGEIPQ